MSRTSGRELVARLIAPATLSGWYREGLTYAEIVFKLRTEHEIKTSIETVRRWIGEESTEPAAASA